MYVHKHPNTTLHATVVAPLGSDKLYYVIFPDVFAVLRANLKHFIIIIIITICKCYYHYYYHNYAYTRYSASLFADDVREGTNFREISVQNSERGHEKRYQRTRECFFAKQKKK